MPIGRFEVIDTESLVIEPPLPCKEDKMGRGTTVNQSHVHILQGIKWNPACQGGILVAVDAARGLSRGISEWEKSESPFRQRSFLPKEFSKKSSQPDSGKEGRETWDRNEVGRGGRKKHRGYDAAASVLTKEKSSALEEPTCGTLSPETISEIPIDRRIERTERKTCVYDE
ncbi:hypothetical protein G5I_09765 [Acromyrmex echinatior]|uniref:Uncharacterized protein n=1 Tax=Acromyrmex echinatior TaxID=103372 RepID=F4WV98_ACREC|nr:hypothetical protein G5I_09765 [Acromyrmex echinatior]